MSILYVNFSTASTKETKFVYIYRVKIKLSVLWEYLRNSAYLFHR